MTSDPAADASRSVAQLMSTDPLVSSRVSVDERDAAPTDTYQKNRLLWR
jgi:hypothetical protein